MLFVHPKFHSMICMLYEEHKTISLSLVDYVANRSNLVMSQGVLHFFLMESLRVTIIRAKF